jgi:hypothetical protein
MIRVKVIDLPNEGLTSELLEQIINNFILNREAKRNSEHRL